MHRAKGLEFDEVLVLLTQPGGTLQPEASDPRRLHYVAVSRAKKMATVIRVG
jgi:DNA helicase IV